MQSHRKPSRRETRDAVRERQVSWVKSLPDATGQSLSRLAQDSGFANTTLTRFIKPTSKGVLSPATIQAVAETAGVEPPAGLLGAERNVSAFREDGAPYTSAMSSEDGTRAAVAALIAGRNDAAPFLIKTDVLALAGIRKGDVLIIDMAATPRQGDVVCVQVETGAGAKTIFRIFQPPHLLVGASLDPNAVRPELVDGLRVRVAGVMTELLRRREPD